MLIDDSRHWNLDVLIIILDALVALNTHLTLLDVHNLKNVAVRYHLHVLLYVVHRKSKGTGVHISFSVDLSSR